MLLLKYRDLSNFKFLVDILMKQRLYSARYFELNDPMEGRYLLTASGAIDPVIEQKLKGEKENLRICSLSRTPNNPLMWSHYADGCRGVVVGVEVKPNPNVKIKSVVYDGPAIINPTAIGSRTAKDILSHKLTAWEYEQEERAFVTGSLFIDVEVKHLRLGERMSNQDVGFMQELHRKLCPNAFIDRQR